jgi:radical SAM superfamily enzyme YgiQ (UPF0313 family)
VWAEVLDDFASGTLQRVYHGQWQDPALIPRARRDVFPDAYHFASIQTSRGCPMNCDFCSVTAFNGQRYRRRRAEDVLDELESIDKELLFFVDDNIIGYGDASRTIAKEIFRGMIQRGIKKHWFCQASLNIADDPEVVDLAGEAGCRMIFVGIEADNEEALASVNKRLNLKRGCDAYAATFDRIHQAGIAVLGAFIFGLDGDTPERIEQRADYIIQSGVDVMQCTVLTPLPGTRLFHEFEQQGRLLYDRFPEDWDRYNLTEVVYRPQAMAADELSSILRDCMQRIYALPVLKEKAKQTLKATGRGEAVEFAWQSNLNYREVALSPTTFATT